MRIVTGNLPRVLGLALAAVPALAGCGDFGPEGTDNNTTGTRAPDDLLASGVYIDPNRSVVVRNVGVVDDSKRTQDPCGSTSSADVSKRWTFGYLVSQMTDGTPQAMNSFVRSWLNSWQNTTTINNDTLAEVKPPPPQPNGFPHTAKPLAQLIREAWQAASGSSVLAMNKAPFRLLAIVNRFDLRKSPRRFGEGASGELRFVFSVLDLKESYTHENGKRYCTQYPALVGYNEAEPPASSGERGEQLVILEYAVDISTTQAKRDWAWAWADLTALDPGTEAYNQALENLTQKVVVRGKGGSRANGSELIRIRTNETADDLQWDLREFQINGSTHLVVPVAVKQTPRDSLKTCVATGNFANCSSDLSSWLVNNSTPILNDTYVVPARFPNNRNFLGSHTTNAHSNTYWVGNPSPAVTAEVRHQFSKNTCSGCHSQETGSQFFHIHGREYQSESAVSGFLGGADRYGEGDFCTEDPVTHQQRCFNEMAKRVADLLSFFNSGI